MEKPLAKKTFETIWFYRSTVQSNVNEVCKRDIADATKLSQIHI